MSPVTVCVDAGTQSVRAVAFDDDGRVAGGASVATPVLRPGGARAEQDMEATWRAAAEAIRAVSRGRRVAAVALTGQGDGCWLVDDRGRPTRPAVLWCDGRAAPVVERWRREGVLEEAHRRSGTLTFPGLANAVLAWGGPDAVASSAALLTCNGWLTLRLTGTAIAEPSDAAAPFGDPATGGYAPELLELFGVAWAERLLPPVERGPLEVSRAAAAELGLPAGTPVLPAPYDVPSTALGAGVLDDRRAFAVLGTTLCMGTVPAARGDCGLWVPLGIDDRRVAAYATLAGGEVVDHVAALLGLAGAAELAALAEQAPPGSGGLLLLPYLSPAGERAPFLDGRARGTLVGLSFEHGREHVARAALEGLALAIGECLDRLGVPAAELRVCGGGAASEPWCRIIAGVTGREVVRLADEQVAARGAWLHAVGPHRVRVDEHVRVQDRFVPEGAGYDALRERFLDVRAAVAPVWEAA